MKLNTIIKICLSVILLIFVLDTNFAQDKTVDTEVKIKGGLKALQENIIYPEEAKSKGIEGEVFIAVTVNKLGRSEKMKFVKGDEIFKSSAFNAINATEFIPATKNDKPVNCEITIPIKYRLSDCK